MSGNGEVRVYFVVPDWIDDPDRVSGGNVYDRQVRDGLRAGGWDVRMVPVSEGPYSHAAHAWSELPEGGLVLVDGLVAVRESEAVLAHASRLRIVVLAHMVASTAGEPNGPGAAFVAPVDREREVLRAVERIIATSEWTRSELIARDLADPRRVIVARPGTAPAGPTVASLSGGRLLCVGVLAPHKGQDLLIQALAQLSDIDRWTCTFVGSIESAPGFVDDLRAAIHRAGLIGRVTFTGTLAGGLLDRAYGRADLVVVPSRSETFGMVITEALARGVPVVAARVGGTPEALSPSGPGILLPPGDPWALGVVLRDWLTSPAHRSELTAAAMAGRPTGTRWGTTVATISGTLHDVVASEWRVPA